VAITLIHETTKTLALEEFVEICNREMEVEDEASVISMAPYLKMLANNPAFLIEYVLNELRVSNGPEWSGGYTAQSMVLATLKRGHVRANLWMASGMYGGDTRWEDKLYTYGYAHNHNFQLLTVGMWGSGYGTEIHELCTPDIIGYVGEPVELRFLEQTNLPKGKVMYYRRTIDVHNQIPPEDFSISLNLMPSDRKIGTTEQYEFDIEKSRVASVIGGQVSSKVSMLVIAKHLADRSLGEQALVIAESNPNHRTRLAAYECAAAAFAPDRRVIWEQATRDEHSFVRDFAEKEMSYL
jgi:hypothetical protein